MCKLLPITIIAVLGLVFQACGQKGPLRLPDRAKPVVTPVQPNTAAVTTASDKPKEP